MREVKFRGQDCFENWQFGSLVTDNKTYWFIRNSVCDVSVDPKTVGQLIFEINGHKFFEGDIISRDGFNVKYAILWNKENQCFSTFDCHDLRNMNDDDELFKLNILCNKEQLRVSFIKKYNFYPVGNIHDNPELLK